MSATVDDPALYPVALRICTPTSPPLGKSCVHASACISLRYSNLPVSSIIYKVRLRDFTDMQSDNTECSSYTVWPGKLCKFWIDLLDSLETSQTCSLTVKSGLLDTVWPKKIWHTECSYRHADMQSDKTECSSWYGVTRGDLQTFDGSPWQPRELNGQLSPA